MQKQSLTIHTALNFGEQCQASLTEFQLASMQSFVRTYASTHSVRYVLHMPASKPLQDWPAFAEVRYWFGEPAFDYLARDFAFYKPVGDKAGDTDFLRAIVLWEEGGLWADLDVFAIKPLPWHEHESLMALQGGELDGFGKELRMLNIGICWAREPGLSFYRLWLDGFNAEPYWADVQRLPVRLRPYYFGQFRATALEHRLGTVLPGRFLHDGHQPFWATRPEIESLQQVLHADSYCIHAYASSCGEKMRLEKPGLYAELLGLS